MSSNSRIVYAVVLMVAMVIGGCGSSTSKPLTMPVEADGLAKLDFRQVIAAAKEKVFPAVVFIKAVRETHESGKKLSVEVAGSGVLISPRGQLLTNWHVVDKAAEVRCLLSGGTYYDARILGIDKDTDLALLQLNLPETVEVPFAELGDSSSLKEGDFVMAMGAPWGLSRSVSIGIISCTKRHLPQISEYSLWLQSDASISPGNSGGPLVNTAGQIIGINSRANSYGGDMGFAIPSETIKQIVPQLQQYGKVNWSWTGLQLQPLKDFDKNVYFDYSDGVIVAETDPESPARRCGIQQRDRIVRVNGKAFIGQWAEDLPALRCELGLLPKEKPATIEVIRGDQCLALTITPRDKGKVEGEELDCPRWDMTLKAINQFDNPDLFFHRNKGVFIFGVKYPGNASSAGLSTQDVILQIDGKDITTLEEARAAHAQAIANVDTKHRIVFSVLRNGLMRQMVLDFSLDHEKE